MRQDQIVFWVNLKDKEEGLTALHFASSRGNIDICEQLIQNGAYIHIESDTGLTVLHAAVQGDQPISIYYFKQKGLDLQKGDHFGNTPLHWAAFSMS